jgi:hypothetical protein
MKRMKDEIPDRVRDDNKLQIPPNPPFSKGEIKYGDRGECISAMPAGIKLGDRGWGQRVNVVCEREQE